MENILKKIIMVLVAIFVFGWLSSTCIALTQPDPAHNTCAFPYRAWAITWPIWKILPQRAELKFVMWTLDQCDK